MAITVTPIAPTDGATNIELDAEVVFNIVDTVDTVDLATLDVDVTVNSITTRAIDNGDFINDYTGEFIDNGGGSDIDVVIILPIDNPRWQQNKIVTIDVNVEATPTSYSFTTKSYKLTYPDTYTNSLTLTSLPAEYSAQSSDGGSDPTFDASGMTTVPNGGTSYIENTSAGLDLDQGLLIDVEVGGIGTDTKVLEICSANQGSVGVNVDFSIGEIYLTELENKLPTGFRPLVKNDMSGQVTVQFRLSVKGSGDDLIARLYTGTIDSSKAILLKQTDGPSASINASCDHIKIGSIDVGGDPVTISKVDILNLSDPDQYYTFPTISNISLLEGSISGGDTFVMRLSDEIDIDLGTDPLVIDESVRNKSTGSGDYEVVSGRLTLSLNGSGTAEVDSIYSYSGDLPSASDISFDVSVDQNLVSNPTQLESILFAIKLSAGGDTIALEYAASISDKTFFRLIRTTGGLQTSNRSILKSSKSNFTIRILRAGKILKITVDGTTILDTSFKDGVCLLKFYTSTSSLVSYETFIENLLVKPVVTIGGQIAET